MKTTIHTLRELKVFAEKLVAEVSSQSDQRSKATVVGLSGDLGSGKTTFVQQLATVLGVTDSITSPTFVIEKMYKLPSGFKHLIHIDAYRLESPTELEKLGFQEILDDPTNFIVIEWPEKVQSLIPGDARFIKFTFIDDKTREVEMV